MPPPPRPKKISKSVGVISHVPSPILSIWQTTWKPFRIFCGLYRAEVRGISWENTVCWVERKWRRLFPNRKILGKERGVTTIMQSRQFGIWQNIYSFDFCGKQSMENNVFHFLNLLHVVELVNPAPFSNKRRLVIRQKKSVGGKAMSSSFLSRKTRE